MKHSFIPELLSPAGNPEKLRFALQYGADCVYLAGKRFGMRAAADNFSDSELIDAVTYAHSLGKKVYLTLNTMPRSSEIRELEEYLIFLQQVKPDAVIVADLGVFTLCQKHLPTVPIHISTQGANVNYLSCQLWFEMGAKRIVLARELSFEDISLIRQNTSPELELEVFIHGAMCVSFSGRCLLSEFYTSRDANRGSCTQPCRWIYRFSEEKRPNDILEGEFHSNEGTYIFGSKDLCMIEHIPKLMQSGINSFKIEGRMKSSYYAAAVTNAYRIAIDTYLKDPKSYRLQQALTQELQGVSHREYCTGYFFNHPLQENNLASFSGYLKEKAYLALVEESTDTNGLSLCIQKNKMSLTDSIEVLSPGQTGKSVTIEGLFDKEGTPITSTPHPQMPFYIKASIPLKKGDILRAAKVV